MALETCSFIAKVQGNEKKKKKKKKEVLYDCFLFKSNVDTRTMHPEFHPTTV